MTDESGSSALPNPVPATAPAQAVETWTAVASANGLVLGQSEQAYAVYDQTNTFGRWPLTADGYRYATETYEAHRQSLAHGLAYTATGYQDPARLGLPTEAAIKSKTYASPLSYVGSTRRILSWAQKTTERSPALNVLTWVGAILALLFMWSFLVFWYFVIFVVFGVFVIPYRLVRRSQRKNMHVQQTSLATQQAMLQQMTAQQQLLAQQQIAAQQQSLQMPQPGSALPPSAPPAINQGPPPTP